VSDCLLVALLPLKQLSLSLGQCIVYVVVVVVVVCVYENVQRGLDLVWRCPIGGQGRGEGQSVGVCKERPVRGKEASSCTCFSDFYLFI
jgi:hypothetical protein